MPTGSVTRRSASPRSLLDVPPEHDLARDIDFLVFSRIIDPVASVVQVVDFARAGQGLATTTLRPPSATFSSTTCSRAATRSTNSSRPSSMR